MKLRGYQEKMLDSMFEAWRTNTATLLVAATGCGKTVVFTTASQRTHPGRTMMVAHRNELCEQAREKFMSVAGLPVEIEKAEQYASTNLFHRTPVVVSSIQTQCSGPKENRRYKRFNPMDFSLLIVDEAHHACSPSWKEVINYYRQNPNLKVLGVTATPDRTDKEALGQVFGSVCYTYDILDGIQDGYLVDITQQFVPVKGLDYTDVHTCAGDLNEGELSKVMQMESNIQGMCQPTLEVIYQLPPKTLNNVPVAEWRSYLSALPDKPRRTIFFTVSVLQAQMCCDVLSRAMPGVEWVCGATPKEKRHDTLARFAKGETHVVANCGVLTEGFDNPGVEVIIMARPTKSRALYAQMVGRSTRPLPGIVDGDELDTAEKRRAAIAASTKKYCRIIDFVGNSGNHKLITCVDILGGKVSEEAAAYAVEQAKKKGGPVRILVTMTNAERELERKKREESEKAREQEAERKKHLLAHSTYSLHERNPFGADVNNHGKVINKKYGSQYSPRQFRFLRLYCGKDPNTIPYGYGVKLIAEEMKRRGWGQRKAA